MKATRVVRLKRSKGEVVQGCDVYIGRKCTMGGWNLEQSKWHNPYTIASSGSAEEAVARYRKYIQRRPHLMASLEELRGKTLGCWCSPGPCHGDVLVELIESPPAIIRSVIGSRNKVTRSQLDFIDGDDNLVEDSSFG